MMKHEFEDRVGVTVSAYEYANIESAYMACDEDKDTFCKRWVKEGSIKNCKQNDSHRSKNSKSRINASESKSILFTKRLMNLRLG